jgi:hypothetical protein
MEKHMGDWEHNWELKHHELMNLPSSSWKLTSLGASKSGR